MSHPRLGTHVPLRSTIYETVSQFPIPCCQFHMGNNRSYQSRVVTSSDRENTLKYCQKYDKTFYVHCPYVVNVGSLKEHVVKLSLESIQTVVDKLYTLRASYVLHIGQCGSIEDVISRLQTLNLKEGDRPSILLECAAGEKGELGSTWEELNKLSRELDMRKFGFCIDTQHSFASGMVDFRRSNSVIECLDRIKSMSGRELDLLHLNDSKVEFQGHVDEHASIAEGYIWKDDTESLETLFQQCGERRIDMVLETPTGKDDLMVLQELFP